MNINMTKEEFDKNLKLALELQKMIIKGKSSVLTEVMYYKLKKQLQDYERLNRLPGSEN